MRACDRRIVRVVAMALVLAAVSGAQAGITTSSFDHAGVDVAPGSMEAVFGVKVAELDAGAYGFNFLFKRDGTGVGYDDPFHGHRNVNVISEVYVAEQAVTVGSVQLQPGDYTFAYTLDYSEIDGLLGDSAIRDFQIMRTVLGMSPAVSNPGPNVPMGNVLGGATNTNAAFGAGGGTPPLEAYPDGMAGEVIDFGVLIADKVEYDWGADLVTPESKAMVLMFVAADAQVWQVGWGSQAGMGLPTMAERQLIGHTGEGGSIVGGGQSIPDSIPLLIPVPEPATLALLAAGALALVRRRD